MYLVLNGDRIEESVDNNLLRETIMTLGPEDDNFVVLSRDEMTYMQAAGDPSTGYIVEYQNGSLDEHYSCVDTDVGVEDVISAFNSYFKKDGRWKSALPWQKEEVAAGGTPILLGPYIRAVLLAVAGVAAVWWLIKVFS